ncbi:MAG: hypothetical protein GTN49_06770 [candidate division Zixibacteria bacterium]|nr:hypothetical protein [candidate division Zixibacteria bacterium]
MKRKYVKPTVASERVFSLAAQACDVEYYAPGWCQDELIYETCRSPWKVENVFCGEIVYPLKERT